MEPSPQEHGDNLRWQTTTKSRSAHRSSRGETCGFARWRRPRRRRRRRRARPGVGELGRGFQRGRELGRGPSSPATAAARASASSPVLSEKYSKNVDRAGAQVLHGIRSSSHAWRPRRRRQRAPSGGWSSRNSSSGRHPASTSMSSSSSSPATGEASGGRRRRRRRARRRPAPRPSSFGVDHGGVGGVGELGQGVGELACSRRRGRARRRRPRRRRRRRRTRPGRRRAPRPSSASSPASPAPCSPRPI